MDTLILAAQLILSLSILIVLHELGHFLPAKKFKMRVDKFYLFFDPYFSLFKVKKGETEYGIGWLPLGGYVKISGMVDESMDKEQMAQPPQPWEFRSKPAWQRLIVMIGGVTVNLILGMFIYAMILFYYGKEYLPLENATYGIALNDSLAYEAGFRNGDQVVSINGKKPKDFRELNLEILLNSGSETAVVLNRNGEEVAFKLAADFPEKLVALKDPLLLSPGIPTIIDSLPPDSKAKQAGLLKGDKIIGVNDQVIAVFQELPVALQNLKGQKADIHVLRNNDSLIVNCPVSEEGTLGFFNINPNKVLTFAVEKYGFFESFPAGIAEGTATLGNYVRQFKLVFTKAGSQKVGGFAAIAQQFDSKWDWLRFWNITAFLSIALAFMNILPIPALDGGHVIFLLYEIITGRKPNDKFMEYAQVVGMVLLLSLLVFANGNDLYKWVVSKF
jgi:regulator of sigma E protease